MVQSPGVIVRKAFATPLGLYRAGLTNETNEQLRDLLLTLGNAAPSTGRSNVGGWRSGHDLLERPEPAWAAFATAALGAVAHMVAAAANQPAFHGEMRITAWANILARGGYNVLHAHPESVWSGVYYVDAGSIAPPPSLSGILELRDPRPGVEMVPAPGWPFGHPLRIEPETGLMVLFPSWLYHLVHPYEGDRPRISIAFNVAVPAPVPARG